ncbi:MAG: 2-isopropylmalate synthase [Aigarchaeota archaeon]|nr:2-isopropylmalate synthase [Aigarchaeota archaeon]MDW8092168.1 2-isopropylmalate synthase [Nitrososphaerota archaeon]
MPERVYVFDTTLRDGEQTPGVSLRREDKILIAEALADLGVDIIEAGFPVVSRGEFETIKDVAKLGIPSKVCVLSRCERKDIDRVLESDAEWIHLFIATSDAHLRDKLKMTRQEVLSRAVEMVDYAKSHGLTVHFSAEDATRSDPDYLMKIYEAVKRAGADSIDIPDTVGFALPHVMRSLVIRAKEVTNLPVAVHCHDDMGLATANTLAGVEGGAEIVHVTINGIGERAGNTSLEEVVVALKFLYGVETNVKLTELDKVSRLVSKLTGMIIPKNKSIVGDNAFTHESGIHVHGVLNNPYTYEPIMPEVVGKRRRIVLGKHSGTHGMERVLREFGYNLSPDQVRRVLDKVKEYADAGIKMTEYRLVNILVEVLGNQIRPLVSLEDLRVTSTMNTHECSVVLNVAGESVAGSARGGSAHMVTISATISALSKVIGNFELVDYTIYTPPYDERNVSEAEVVVSRNGQQYVGRGISNNPSAALSLAVASAISQYLQSVNVKSEVTK